MNWPWRRWHGNPVSLLPITNWPVIRCKGRKEVSFLAGWEGFLPKKDRKAIRKKTLVSIIDQLSGHANIHTQSFCTYGIHSHPVFPPIQSPGSLSGTCPFHQDSSGTCKLTHYSLSPSPSLNSAHTHTYIWAHRQKQRQNRIASITSPTHKRMAGAEQWMVLSCEPTQECLWRPPPCWKDRRSLGWSLVLFTTRHHLVSHSPWPLLSRDFSLIHHHGGPITREGDVGK